MIKIIDRFYINCYTLQEKTTVKENIKLKKQIEQLETDKQKIIEKLEEDIENNNFKETQCLEDKGRYYYAQEILKILKGEQERKMINDFEKNKIFEFNVVGEVKDNNSDESYDVVLVNNKKYVYLGNDIFLDYNYLNTSKFNYWEVVK